MKIIKINDNLKINIDHIYSLEKKTNNNEIKKWEDAYKEHIDLYAKNPISLEISDNKFFQPKYGEKNNEEDLKLYGRALKEHIISIIGYKPEYNEKYYIILSSGLKINITKTIYDKVNTYLDKYIDNDI